MSYTSRTPCKFFQQGNCRRGNSCKFGHFLANDNNRTTSNDDPYKSFISPTSIDKHKKQILDDMADTGKRYFPRRTEIQVPTSTKSRSIRPIYRRGPS